MDEKFKTSLELDISKFKEGIERVKETFKNVGNIAKKDVVLDTNNLKDYSSEQKYIMSQIDDIKHKLDLANKGFEVGDVLKLESDLDRLNKKLNDTNKQVNKLGNISDNIQKGFEKGMKSAKRFTLSLFGIQSGFRMLSRASSAYLAQDEETSQKIQSAWIGLGSVFAPVLEKIANFVIKAVSYINVFIKALTGVDFLARAMDKSMKKTNKTAGKLSKTLSGFDEINNLDDSAGGVSIDTSWIDAFKNIKLDPELIEKITNFGLAVKNIWDKYVSPFFKFMKDNWDGAGKDIVGFALLGGMIFDALTGNWIGLLIKFVGFVALYWDDIKESTKVLMDAIKTIFKKGFDILVDLISIPVGFIKDIIKSITTSVEDVIKGAKKIFNGLIDFITGVFTGDWKKAWQGVKNVFAGIFETLGGVIKLPLNLIIDGLNAIVKGVNNILVKGLNKLLGLGKLVGINIEIPKIPTIPKLEIGTNYVPEDTLAMIHKGEAVVPKKFNSSEYFGSGNDETNNLLRVLIETLEEKEMSVNIDKNAIGQASADYINSQKRIIGRGVI